MRVNLSVDVSKFLIRWGFGVNSAERFVTPILEKKKDDDATQ